VLVVFGWYQRTGLCYACQVLDTKCSICNLLFGSM
jgi:hypothetical protein